jgi:3'-phosphoadenosine 5'-phosphosulfate sulfotransferase (PAPS reductase)/FAD synthetase
MTELEEFMGRHQRVALMFSAGKDSAACLKLLLPWLDRVTLIWANPGRPYREVVEYMAAIRANVPHFIEARGDQPGWIEANGWPADSVPFEATPVGRACNPFNHTVPLAPAVACRSANLWEPALWALRSSGCSGVVKGEKLCDRPLPFPLQTVFEGREYFRPLLQWSDAEVFEFIGNGGVLPLPPGYARGLTGSLDCATCTAFLERNPGRLRELAEVDPAAAAEVAPVLAYMREQAARHLECLDFINNAKG